MMKAIAYIVAILITNSTYSQVIFQVKASKSTMGLHETVQVDFEINTEEENFTPPHFNDFIVLNGPSTKVSKTWEKGNVIHNKTITYHIKPRRNGELTINEAILEVNQRVYTTKPVSIEVDDTYVSDDDKLFELNVRNNVHLVSEFSMPTIGIDELIVITYKLYVSQDVGINNWNTLVEPSSEGFEIKPIEFEQMKVLNETYEGRSYRYVVIRKTELKPKTIGVFTIEPYQLNVSIDMPSNTKDAFGHRIIKPINRIFATDSISITVK